MVRTLDGEHDAPVGAETKDLKRPPGPSWRLKRRGPGLLEEGRLAQPQADVELGAVAGPQETAGLPGGVGPLEEAEHVVPGGGEAEDGEQGEDCEAEQLAAGAGGGALGDALADRTDAADGQRGGEHHVACEDGDGARIRGRLHVGEGRPRRAG